MKVGIIGCGPSGLNAIKLCLAEGYEVTAFEKSADIGGEWYSTGEVGKDVHSKIYEGLVTNLPKEAMAYSDYPFEECDKSFLTQKEVHKYFKSYANAFELHYHIKLRHQAIQARPLVNEKWEIIAKDIPKNVNKTYIFDAVFVCAGIAAPFIPKIEGQKDFKGQILHSRDYRNPSLYVNKKVLLIGSGTSALDLMLHIGKVAEKVAWVHLIKEKIGLTVQFELPKSVTQPPAIKRITEIGAEFVDGTAEKFDFIVFATGYDISFPFLSVDSGLYNTDKCVYPLYKQCISISKPNLFIIGLTFLSLRFIPMFELQNKFCLQFLSGRKCLPPKHEMLADAENYINNKASSNGTHKNHFSRIEMHELYYRDLAECAEIEPMKPVFAKILNHTFMHLLKDFLSFRKYKSKILNDNEFVCSCSRKI